MTASQTRKYRAQLEQLAGRVRETAAGLEESVRTPTSGESAGGLSNVPMHLGDVGSEVYNQELSATLLENEDHIRGEVDAALGRLDAGTFGTCERCQQAIAAERLEALPYARFCVGCAAAEQAGAAVNLNAGRPDGFAPTFSQDPAGTPPEPAGGRKRKAGPVLFTDLEEAATDDDVHAAGTPGGGTAVGGLAGTNAGRGDPSDASLESAMGSGNFDVAAEEEDEDREVEAYSGAAGGAVGGTPANKRAVGGRAKGGTTPRPAKGDSPTGQ